MNRFYGNVGYAIQVETNKGRWEDSIVERPYYGELKDRSWRNNVAADQVHDNIRLNTDLEIIANPFAIEHFSEIRYVCYGGARWVVTGITCKYPRIHLTLGGIYNGPIPES